MAVIYRLSHVETKHLPEFRDDNALIDYMATKDKGIKKNKKKTSNSSNNIFGTLVETADCYEYLGTVVDKNLNKKGLYVLHVFIADKTVMVLFHWSS